MISRRPRARQLTRALPTRRSMACPRRTAACALRLPHPRGRVRQLRSRSAQSVITASGISRAPGLAQLRIAGTEKYAHVTCFFSGGVEAYTRARIDLVPSPQVATYDLQPEMSAPRSPTSSSPRSPAQARRDRLHYEERRHSGPRGHRRGDTGGGALDACVGRVVDAARTPGGEAGHRHHGSAEQIRRRDRAAARGPHAEPGPVRLRRARGDDRRRRLAGTSRRRCSR